MIPFLGCEQARELLESYVDDELPLSDQVAVESHLRTCATCTARIEDMRLIALSLRVGSPANHTAEDDRAFAGIQAGTLARLRAEQDLAMGPRLREAFADMRLLWPALGAFGAVVLGLAVALGMLHLAGTERPESLAAIIQSIAQRGAHGADGSHADAARGPLPLSLESTMFGPQMIEHAGVPIEGLSDEDMVVLTAVLSSQGRIEEYALLGDRYDPRSPGSPQHAAEKEAVRDALSRMRFAPALAFDGSGVPVELIMVMANTTAILAPVPAVPRAVPTPVPSLQSDEAAADEDPEVDIMMDEPPPFDHPESRLLLTPRLPWT